MSYFEDKHNFSIAKRLGQTTATTTPQSFYSPPSTHECILTHLVVANYSNVARTFTFWYLHNAGPATDTNIMFNEIDVPKNSTRKIELGFGLQDSGIVYVQASANNSLNVFLFGVETEII